MSANVEIDESSRKPEQRRDELYRPLRVYVFFLFQKRGVPVARRIYYIYVRTRCAKINRERLGERAR